MLLRASSRDLLGRALVPDVPLNRSRRLPSNTRTLHLEPLADRRLLFDRQLDRRRRWN